MRTASTVAALATLLAFTLAGCSTSDLASPQTRAQNTPAKSASGGVTRPWKGDCSVEYVFTSETTLTITGTCQLAHLGRTTIVNHQTVELVDGVFHYTNDATYVAANGDVLRVIGAGTATPTATGLTLVGTEVANGGTGAFANATGTAALNGIVQPNGPISGRGLYRMDGQLTY